MKIFIDSANIDEIKQSFAWGIANGVTTNPSLMKKAVDLKKKQTKNLNLKSYINQILKVAKGTPVSLEVTKTDTKGMIEQGKKLFKLFNPIAKNVYIKIPINPAFKEKDSTHFDGIIAIKQLSKLKIPTNCTLVFTPEQALLAAKAGASFISPFAGRIDDLIRTSNKLKFEKTDYYPAKGKLKGPKLLQDNGIVSGIDLVSQCVDILRYYNLKSQVLAASLRSPRQVRESALVGADIATVPFNVIKDMLKHQKTYEGMAKFTKDIIPEYEKLTK
jgi:transaldolase